MGCRADFQFPWSVQHSGEAAFWDESHLAGVTPPHRAWSSPDGRKGWISMHDLLIALAFIGLVIAPAIVATKVNVEALDDSK